MQNNKILLINPWIHDFSAYDFWVRPLGLLTLAALLRQSGFKVQVIDCLDPFPTGKAPGGQPGTRKRQDWGCGKFPSEEIPKPEALRPIRRRYRRYGLSPNVFRQILAGRRQARPRPGRLHDDLLVPRCRRGHRGSPDGLARCTGLSGRELCDPLPGTRPGLLGGRCRHCRRRGVCAAPRSRGSVRHPRRFRTSTEALSTATPTLPWISSASWMQSPS